MKRILVRFLPLVALFTAISVLLSSCNLVSYLLMSIGTPFDEIEYVRPSYDEIKSLTDDILDAFENDASYRKISSLVNKFFSAYSTFQTMYALANLNYSLDTQNSEYLEECNYFTEHSILLEKCREEVLVACANSSYRERMEKTVFLTSIEDYKDYHRYTDPQYLALSIEEAKLVEEYRVTVSDATVDGVRVWDAMEEASDAAEYNRLLTAFYTEYAPVLSDIYHQLAILRKQLAKEAGFDNYFKLAGEGLGREFEIDQMRDYLEGLKKAVQNSFSDIDSIDVSAAYRECGEAMLYEVLSSTCDVLDQQCDDEMFGRYYQLMKNNQLSDFSKTTKKENTSFTVFLFDYFEPYIMINPEGNLTDILTVFHEYGHFCEMYYTFDSANSIDLAEVYSTGFEMIALQYLDDTNGDLSAEEIAALQSYSQAMVYETIVSQGILSEFEMAIYDPKSKVDTSDFAQVCELYRTIANEWGYRINETDVVGSAGWTVVPHIFQYPSYVFSYCISMDIALQLRSLEQSEAGKGLACYIKLLDRDIEADFTSVMTDAGLVSPFDEKHFDSIILHSPHEEKIAA